MSLISELEKAESESRFWEAEASLAKEEKDLQTSDNAKIGRDSEGNTVIKIFMINGQWAEYNARSGTVEEYYSKKEV